MDVSGFDFELPSGQIASRPVRPRSVARMLVVERDRLRDRHIGDLADELTAGDLLVFNDTRVIPARLFGVRRAARGTANVELMLNRQLPDGSWSALAKPARKLRDGDALELDGLQAEVTGRGPRGEVLLRFSLSGPNLLAALERVGRTPIPPYLGREADAADRADYQTVFAREPGAVAAPTAGLHFDDDAVAAFAARGIGAAFVTLHVGAGTFLPVSAADTDDHVMHPEWGCISKWAAEQINDTRAAGGRLVAVGTTVLRLLESAVDAGGAVRRFAGETSIFLTPGHRFRTASLLLTNFHLPRSTLFMLVCAFAGTARMHAAYRHAIESGYRFYSYGDACLLESAT
ncbi:MAG: tRNA preQ1(34) S-adenosylmethionine ribosyltransferase-isomerase QueA [Proteobacteria bacterium]|nr:tRNA preQ1(34) S-adenosylmethionine ribosyltransferase-isomerase QueA [Pseudomonadota bacterium]